MKRLQFNDNWSFKKEGAEPRVLCLPHDAMLEETRNAENPSGNGSACFGGGSYEYEKTFFAPREWEEQEVQFEFEGVYPHAEVYLNGEKLGDCFYGYSDYRFRAKHLRYDAENVMRVVVDNSEVPNSRWYSGAGIYRPVWLLTGAKAHILPGTLRVKTIGIEPAEIEVSAEYTGAKDSAYRLQVEIFDGETVVAGADLVMSGKTPAANDKQITAGLESLTANAKLAVADAKLWDAEHPNLYKCKATLLENDTIGDEEIVSFGIRQLTWSTKGFFVNGKETLLKGGCVHHDNGILGAKSYKESEFRRIKRLKEFGFNAIRSSHNPAGRDVLEACDTLGMYVMDEGWDMWYETKTKGDYANRFMEHYEEDILAMVAKDYNHPSVIMYSVGNEVTEPSKQEGVELAKKLVDAFHAADDSRPTTAGINITLLFLATMGINLTSDAGQDEAQKREEAKEPEKVNSTYFNEMVSQRAESMKMATMRDDIEAIAAPTLDALDIAGYNYASCRYPLEQEKHPERIVVGSETYPYELPQNWKVVEEYPYLIGDFMWTAWDYLGESGIGSWSYDPADMGFGKTYPWLLADTGAFDILGNDTAEAGMAAAVWGVSEKPYIYAMPANHNPKEVIKSMWRGSNALPYWSYEGCEGNDAVVEVYSKADTVELFVNGKSIGRKQPEDTKAVFETVYEAGTIEAVAYAADGTEISRSELRSASGTRGIHVIPEQAEVKAGEIVYVDISIRGENGEVECNADATLKVTVEGGELLAFGSANPKTEEDFLSGTYTTYYGRAQAVIRVEDAGELVITAAETAGERGYQPVTHRIEIL